MLPDIQPDQLSDRFACVDADVTFRSCNGILFKVHHKNLDTHTEAFASPPTVPSQNEIISLTEDSDTVDLLFQYIYPRRQPNLKIIEFAQLAKLAEAAEKYQVYAAIDICNVRMGEAFAEHPFEVMMYALRHGYKDLMDNSERKALELSPTAAFECLPLHTYVAWELMDTFFRPDTMLNGWTCLQPSTVISPKYLRINMIRKRLGGFSALYPRSLLQSHY
ncbi:hypothetical protein HWV62_42006 [Athelia sp. TMB]|nr:hypothetical protein HWV62_42006 [Athelia sp. TMB]